MATRMTPESSSNPVTKFVPSARKSWLCLLSGLMWSGVGIFLCTLTIPWLQPLDLGARLGFIFGGLFLAISISLLGFSPFAEKNIRRIDAYRKDKVCIFAFQKWSSYPLVLFMIGLGIFLRKYSPIPKPWLAVLYLGIGGSLFLASLRYYARIWQGSLHG